MSAFLSTFLISNKSDKPFYYQFTIYLGKNALNKRNYDNNFSFSAGVYQQMS